MKTNDQLLLKHFSSVLRNRANGNQEPISATLLKYLSRKDLVEVIKKIHNGSIPKELDLALMENEELLSIIKDEMYVIAFITERWSKEQTLKVSSDNKDIIQKMDTAISKAVANEKKDKKPSSAKDKTKK
jgi:hypothetical protein